MGPEHRLYIICFITYSTLPRSWFFTYVKWNKRINGQNDNFELNWLVALENYYKFRLSCSIVLSRVYSSNLQIYWYMCGSVLLFFWLQISFSNLSRIFEHYTRSNLLQGSFRVHHECVYSSICVCLWERDSEFFLLFIHCAKATKDRF